MTKKQLFENFIVNMERERIRLGLTQVQMAQKLDMSPSAYKKKLSGETQSIDLYTAYLLYHLSGKWCYELIDEPISGSSVLPKYFSLPDAQKQFIEGLVDFELSIAKEQQQGNDMISVFVPTGNMVDGMVYDSAHFIKADVSSYRAQFGENLHCGIKITSNHLYPVYHKGDILLICRKPPRDGDTGIFLNKESGTVYIRKFFQADPCILEPINEYGECFTLDFSDQAILDKWIKFGYVLTKIRS
ncbi:MAG: DNA-binding protein [Lachnospiraceae bacterium]|nr:DNA-binding protein [Lachnospiraceae bacterium]